MAFHPSTSSSKLTGKTEFEILKESHKFLREDDEGKGGLSWDEQLASKYYASLYREFAVCDLKHYKSGNFALRWRTEDEVLSGAGETTCGNTRCEHHILPDHLARRGQDTKPRLTTLELPFVYVEHGENKSALVKVVLCPRCLDKLMYKRRKQKQKMLELVEDARVDSQDVPPGKTSRERRDRDGRDSNGEEHFGSGREKVERHPRLLKEEYEQGRSRKRNSRSRSPLRRKANQDA